MAEQAPEDAIREYLDENGGQEHVGLGELMGTWNRDEKNGAARAEVAADLRKAGVATDPHLNTPAPEPRSVCISSAIRTQQLRCAPKGSTRLPVRPPLPRRLRG